MWIGRPRINNYNIGIYVREVTDLIRASNVGEIILLKRNCMPKFGKLTILFVPFS